MAIDEQLLNQNNRSESEEEIDEESMAAGDFREQQRSTGLDMDENPGQSLRELKQSELAKNAATESSSLSGDLSGKISQSAILATTDDLLKAAWENLIDSFGLTLIWIDIHFFLNKVFGPKVFRRLGQEWVPDPIKKMGGEKMESASALLTKTEEAGCACLNLGCLFLVIASLSMAAIIASAVSSPFKTLYDVMSSGGLSELLNIIKSTWF
jgi:hypothetical protein